MTVYVDQPGSPYGRMIMCHMIADTDAELHDMAKRIGIRRQWFQEKRIHHYDISKTKRTLAVSQGAVEVSSKRLVAIARGHRVPDTSISR